MKNQVSSISSEHPILVSLGFISATPVQREAIPVLSAGRSVCVLAPTGSGKTLAFLIPLMERLDLTLRETQLLILAPTRELGAQIAQVALHVSEQLASETRRHIQVRTAFGGQKSEHQKTELLKKPEVVVATPGRAGELISQGILSLGFLKALVLDEADVMLGLGFESQIQSICEHLPRQVQAALFSATESDAQTRLKNRLVHRGVRIDLRRPESDAQSESLMAPVPQITHQYVSLSAHVDKCEILARLLRQIETEIDSGIVFCETRQSVQTVLTHLQACGISAAGLSGELGQIERSSTLRRFKSGSVRFLVATNIAARGIDVSELSVVVHAEIPSTAQDYLHRSGRTGRAGHSGRTISLCTPRSLTFLQGLLQDSGIQLNELKLDLVKADSFQPAQSYVRIHINRGKSSKVRPGDILGALTQQSGLARGDVGGIFIFDHFSHVEISCQKSSETLRLLQGKRIKNLPIKATLAEALAPVRKRSF